MPGPGPTRNGRSQLRRGLCRVLGRRDAAGAEALEKGTPGISDAHPPGIRSSAVRDQDPRAWFSSRFSDKNFKGR